MTKIIDYKIHLRSGQTIQSLTYDDDNELADDTELEDLAKAIYTAFESLERPGWLQLDNVVAHTQSISAIEFIDISDDGAGDV